MTGRNYSRNRLKTGDFVAKRDAAYKVTTDGTQRIAAAKEGILSVSLTLDGATTLRIEKE